MADEESLSKEDLDLVDTMLTSEDEPEPEPAPEPEPKAEEPKPEPEPPKQPEAKKAEPAKADDWRGTITDEALRNIASRYDSPESMARAIQTFRSANQVKIPGKDASAEDVAKFRKAIGVPEKVEDYAFTAPEGLDLTEADQAVVAKLLPIAHQNGLPKDGTVAFVQAAIAMSHEMQQAGEERVNKAQEQSVAELHRKWPGDEFQANVNLAKRAVETLAVPGFKEFAEAKIAGTDTRIGDHPVMLQALAFIQRQMTEGSALITQEQRQSAQQELDDLNRLVPPGSVGYSSAAHQQKLRQLYEQVSGSEPIVGAGGRSV